jgi:hypothetical protein
MNKRGTQGQPSMFWQNFLPGKNLDLVTNNLQKGMFQGDMRPSNNTIFHVENTLAKICACVLFETNQNPLAETEATVEKKVNKPLIVCSLLALAMWPYLVTRRILNS